MDMVKDCLFNEEEGRNKEYLLRPRLLSHRTGVEVKIKNLRVVVNPKAGRNLEESLVKEESVIIVVRKDI